MPLKARIHVLLAITLGAPFSTPDDFDRFVSHYYENPEPDRVVPSLLYMAREMGVPAEDNDARKGLVAFYAGILRRDPSANLAGVRDMAALQDEAPAFLWQVLWFAGTPAARALLETLAPPRTSPKWERWDRQRQSPPPDPLTLPPEDAGALEVFWGSFFATGDTRYVERVIGVLALARVEHDARKIRIGASAEASLVANARQHPKVMEICKAELAKQPKRVRRVLQEVLARAAAP